MYSDTLIAAIQKVTADYDFEAGQDHDPIAAILGTRVSLDYNDRRKIHAEINGWELEDSDLTESYHMVMDASYADLAAALRRVIANTSH